jgi:hypothetical protein
VHVSVSRRVRFCEMRSSDELLKIISRIVPPICIPLERRKEKKTGTHTRGLPAEHLHPVAYCVRQLPPAFASPSASSRLSRRPRPCSSRHPPAGPTPTPRSVRRRRRRDSFLASSRRDFTTLRRQRKASGSGGTEESKWEWRRRGWEATVGVNSMQQGENPRNARRQSPSGLVTRTYTEGGPFVTD